MSKLCLFSAGSTGSGTTSFSPTDILSLSGWWEADTVTPVADGTQTAPIVDASANANNLITPGGADTPLLYYNNVKNGKPSLRANGTSAYYKDNDHSKLAMLSASAWSAFAIGKVTVDTNDATLWHNDAFFSDRGNGDWGIFFKSTGVAIAANYDGTSTKTISLSYTTDTWAIFHVRLAGGNLYFSINGGAESSIASGNTDATILNAGIFTGGAFAYTGLDMLGMAFFNAAISSTDKANCLNYWNTKYAIY